MKDNTCPNCGSHEIYISQNGGGVGSGLSMYVLSNDAMRPIRDWETHLCASCGYFENFILNRETIQQIVQNPQKNGWKKAHV